MRRTFYNSLAIGAVNPKNITAVRSTAGSTRLRVTESLSTFKMDSVTRFFASGFFHESSSPKPMKIKLGSFQTFSKFLGDICKSRGTTCIIDNSSKFSAGVKYTSGKPSAKIKDTGGKFFHQYGWCC
jgi:hypothetical protein